MAFILSQSDTVTLDVSVTVEGGTDKFKAKFKRPTQSDVERIFNEDEPMGNKEMLEMFWLSFSGLQGDDGEVEYNDKTRQAVLSVPEANTALASTFTKFIGESLGKNNKLNTRSKN